MVLLHYLRICYQKCILTFLVVFLTACSGGDGGTGLGSGSGSGTLSWTIPTEREDGKDLPLDQIGGYRIYYGLVEGDYLGHIDISDNLADEYLVEGIPSGKYFVVMTTVDIDGRESMRSAPALEVLF